MEKYFNLQLFAEPNTNVTTQDSMNPTMKEFYDTQLLENARNAHYYNQFGMEQGLPKNGGNTVEFRKFNTFDKAMKPLQEGVTPDGNNLGMTKINVKIQQYGDYSTISDRLELEAVDPVIMGATEEHAAQAGDTLDTVTRNAVIGGTQVFYANATSSSAGGRNTLTGDDKITGKLVSRAATQLKKMKAPKINGDYVAIIHPSVADDLRQDEQWLDAHKYAQPEEIFNGEIGKLHGVRFVEDTEQKVYCGGDLSDESRTLTLASAASNDSEITVKETLEADALKGRYVLIDDNKYYVSGNGADGKITLKDAIDLTTEAKVTAASGATVYPGEGGKEGCAVYATVFMGANAYGRIKPSAESLEVIVKQRGSSGTSDPLDQRSTVGWKASHAAIILYQERIVRLESGSSYSEVDEGN